VGASLGGRMKDDIRGKAEEWAEEFWKKESANYGIDDYYIHQTGEISRRAGALGYLAGYKAGYAEGYEVARRQKEEE
jgi:hypothetical protein